MSMRWGPSTGQAATTRAFCGFTSDLTAPTDVDPSTLTDVLGMGWDTADNSVQIMHRTGSGTTQKESLSAVTFPVPTVNDTTTYLFEIYCPPNGSTVSWRLENPGLNVYDSGDLSSDLPASTTMLAPRVQMSVAGVSSVIGIAFMHMVLFTET